MTVLLAAWLTTGIVVGIVMSHRRHDRFPWWLLGVAFGPLLVPLALGEERREEPTGRAGPPQESQDRAVPALVAIDRRTRQTREEGRMTMTTAATQVELEPPVLDEPALEEDIVEECGLGSFPASDPPSWWAAG
jgi:hypothetical protein